MDMEAPLLCDDGSRFRVTRNTLRIPLTVRPEDFAGAVERCLFGPAAPEDFAALPNVAELLLNETRGALRFRDSRMPPQRLNAAHALELLGAVNRARRAAGESQVSPPVNMIRAARHWLAKQSRPHPWNEQEARAYPGRVHPGETLWIHDCSGEAAIERVQDGAVLWMEASTDVAREFLSRQGYLGQPGQSWVFPARFGLRRQLERMGATDDPQPRSRGSG